MKKWTLQGQLVPFELGTNFQNYQIQGIKKRGDRFFYLAQGPQGQVVLAESYAFFDLEVFRQIRQVIQPLLAEAEMDWLDLFQYDWQGLNLNYVVYPAWLWQALDQPFKEYLWQEGLPEDHDIQQLYDWMQSQQKWLMQQGWCNPSISLPMLVIAPNGHYVQLEWEYCIPIGENADLKSENTNSANTISYPRFFVGYHERAYQQPLELVKTASYATLIAVLQGKSPKLWQLERVTWQSIRPLLTNPMRRFLENYLDSDELWPELPSKIYSEHASRNDYVWAYQSFEKAIDAYEQKHYQEALSFSQTAAQTWLNDPWPYYLKAKIFESQGQIQPAIEALSQAWMYEKLACFARDLAELLMHQGKFSNAETYLKQVLQQTPFDDKAWYLMGCLAQQTHYLEQARQYFTQAYRLRPMETRYRQSLNLILKLLGLEDSLPQIDPIGKKTHLSLDLSSNRTEMTSSSRWQGEKQLSAKRDHPSELWLATDQKQRVMLKLIKSRYDCQREARLASELKHPGFMQVIDFGQNHIAYEWLAGTGLDATIRLGPCETDVLKPISRQLSEATDFLRQKGITHGDLSPANLFWNPRSGSLKIIDYDSLRLTQDNTKSSVFTQVSYAPPEFWRAHQAEQSTDLYSAGLSLLHLASGIFPDLCRDWHRRDFYRYRRYLTHLQDDWVECLLSNTHWDLSKRRLLQLPELVLSRPIPQHLRDLNQALLTLSECQNATQAPELIQDLIQLEKSLVTSYHAAFHAHRLHLYGLSIQYAKECLRMDFRHLGAYWILADIYLQNQRTDEAVKLLRQALDHDSQAPETWQLLINAYRQSGSVNLAFAACQHLKKIMPNHLESKLQELALLADFHFDTQALRIIQQLLEQNIPEHVRERIKGLQKNLLLRRHQKNQKDIA